MFALEEDTREENVPEMSHLHVVPILVNGVAEEEALLDSGSQIVLITQEVTILYFHHKSFEDFILLNVFLQQLLELSAI